MTTNTHIISASDNLCEVGFESYYCNLVSYFQNNSRDNLNYRQFSNRTNRAKNALQCEQEAIFYTVAYAWTHYLSMQRLLSDTFAIIDTQSNVNEPMLWQVIDYGCGQGIASLALLEHIANMPGATQYQIDLVLIEPSQVSLDIAAFLCERLAVTHNITLNIQKQACPLEDAQMNSTIAYDKTLHLMSNVLDIKTVQKSLDGIVPMLDSLAGEHLLMATGPTYPSTQAGYDKLTSMLPHVDCLLNKTDSFYNDEYRVTSGHWINRKTDRYFMALSWSDVEEEVIF